MLFRSMAPFAAGLQVYWMTTNILTILQQKLLYARHPVLQQAAVKALAAQGSAKSVELLLAPWKTFGPATRREVVDQLVSSAAGATALVKAVETGSIKIGEIERDKRQLLLNHPNGAVKEAARKVLAEPPSNRKQVVADYQATLDLTGDAARGQMLYGKTCVQCHRAGTAGHQVGRRRA